MKAIFFDEHGGPEVLQYGDLDDPAPGPGEVLLAVKAASVNHIDIFVRRGMPGVKVALPHVPGGDASGVVEEMGEGVTSVAVGDRVLINPSIRATSANASSMKADASSAFSCHTCTLTSVPIIARDSPSHSAWEGLEIKQIATTTAASVTVTQGLSLVLQLTEREMGCDFIPGFPRADCRGGSLRSWYL